MGSGEVFGNGPGSSNLKNGHLPAAHTDFILAILGEEYGFFGVLLLFTIFGIIFHNGLRIVQIASDRFGLFLALGIVLNLIFYFLIKCFIRYWICAKHWAHYAICKLWWFKYNFHSGCSWIIGGYCS